MQTAHKLPDLSSLIAYKAIKLRKQSPKEAKKIQEKYGLSLVTAKVLAARGYSTTDELASFLQPTLRTGLADPSDLKSLKEASLLIEEIVLAKCPIAVCCDFDVDGLSGGSQIVHFLKSIGSKVEVFVPDRFTEGYGLNAGMVNAANERGCKLLITVDFGTTNEAELALARDKGMKSIVIDHHHVSKNPPADVFVNPCQAGCGFAGSILCAAGLVWYLLLGIRKWTQIGKSFDPKMYLDLACLGTICDMVPLVGVNRIIAKRGLELLHHTERPGLRALRDVSGVHKAVHCHHVSFG
ncbi:MAG: DHH family phosphoesterase, partial [Bdellovibrionales bacterium]|nr:DHH family phosphoesterase [Bdellovibrionales bacterium]